MVVGANPVGAFPVGAALPPPFHKALLDRAKQLISQKEFGLAVVTAQTACEVLTEQVFTVAFAKKGVGFLADSVGDLFQSYNLNNSKLRAVYQALTADVVTNQRFWSGYVEHVARRNRVVHSGEAVTEQQANASWDAARDLLHHLEGVMSRL